MTLDEIKDKYARDHGFPSFAHITTVDMELDDIAVLFADDKLEEFKYRYKSYMDIIEVYELIDSIRNSLTK